MKRTPPLIRRLIAPLLAAGAMAGCDSGATPVAPEPSEPAAPDDRLLTDEELAPPAPANSVDLPAEWVDWVVRNRHPIRSLTADEDFSDLHFLGPALAGRRIVQLGESGHGVREFSQAKVRLIKYLHQELGYDVIAFESGLFECWQADQVAIRMMGGELLRRCAFQVWHTSEVAELFDYIRKTRTTDRPLRLAGFDSQISSFTGIAERDDFFAGTVSAFNPGYAEEVDRLEDRFLNDYRAQAFLGAYAEPYAALLDSLEMRRSQVDRIYPTEPARWRIARQSAWSMTRFVEQLTSSMNRGSAVRDSAMAVNVEFLADSIFPDRKIMIWAHNYHIMNDAGTMGEWLRARFGEELYTVGLYMHEGTATNNARQRYTIREPSEPGLEALLNRARIRYLFIDLAAAGESPGTAWMDQEILTRSWGITPDPLVPRDQYDGLVFIHTVSVPDYLR